MSIKLLKLFLLALAWFLFFPAPPARAFTLNAPSNFLTLNSGLVGWWTFDGGKMGSTVVDSSGNGNNGYMQGFAATSSAKVAGKIGQALKFNGSSYISTVDGASLSPGTGDMSVGAWVKTNKYVTGSQQIIFNNYGAAMNNVISVYLKGSNGKEYFNGVFRDGSANTATSDGVAVLSLKTWYYVVVVRRGTTVYTYVNGVLDSSGSNSSLGTVTLSDGNAPQIGRNTGGTDYFFGSIDDVRVYNRALSATEITKLYNMGASGKVNASVSTPNLNSGLVGYWTFDGKDTPWTSPTAATTLDKSGNYATGTLTSMNRKTAVTAGAIGQGLKFKTGDYVRMTAFNNPTILGNNLTISTWVKPNNTTQDEYISSFSYNLAFNFILGYQDGYYNIYDNDYPCGVNPVNSQIPISGAGVWDFITWVRNGTTLTGYVNGVQKSNCTITGTPLALDPGFQISGIYGQAGIFTGSIDDYRIYNRALSAAEITKLYNLGASGKVNASVSTPNLNNGLVGYWTFDGKDTPWTSPSAATTLDKSGNYATGTLTNMNKKTAPVIGKIGQGMKFDGVVGNYVNLGNPSIYNFDTSSPFSLSAWIKPASVSGNGLIFSKENTSYVGWEFFQNTSWMTVRIENVRYSSIINVQSAAGSIKANQWQHVMLTYDGSAKAAGTKIYINGALNSTGTIDNLSGSIANIGNVKIGGTPADGADQWYFKGSIDDVRIYSRALSAKEVQELYNMGK